LIKLEYFFKQKQFLDSAKKAALIGLGCWLAFGLFLENLAASAALGLLCFSASIALFSYYPKMQGKQKAQRIEACLPFSLSNIAIDLNLGLPFLKAIKHAGREKNCCGYEFNAIEKEVRVQGSSVEEALRHFAERTDSRLVKRAVIQLAAAFEQGSCKKAGEPIKRISKEMLARQRIEAKLFSGKMVVSSLLFIAVSAIVPALFQSFSIVGSAILHMSFTATQLFLIIVAGFPLLDITVLLYIRSQTPVFLRGQ